MKKWILLLLIVAPLSVWVGMRLTQRPVPAPVVTTADNAAGVDQAVNDAEPAVAPTTSAGDSEAAAPMGVMERPAAAAGETAEAVAAEPVQPRIADDEDPDEVIVHAAPNPASTRAVARRQRDAHVDQVYGDLFSQLDLTDKERDRLRKMLSLKPRFHGRGDNDADLRNIVVPEGSRIPMDEAQVLEKTVLSLLGEERYATYQAYEETLSGRWMVRQYANHLESVGSPLDQAQMEKLLEVVVEEQQRVPAVSAVDALQDLQSVPDKMAANLAAKEQAETAILARAGTFLRNEQTTALKDLQAARTARERRSVATYRLLFQSGGAAVVPPAGQ